MKKLALLLLLSSIFAIGCNDDDSKIILGTEFSNPSFEGNRRIGTLEGILPDGLTNCGFEDETGPDVQPGTFGVTLEPFDGKSYIGLVVRENDTWERFSTELGTALELGKIYDFSLALARSETYESVFNGTPQNNFITPCVLRIWGGQSDCDRAELIAETETIEHAEWKVYDFEVKPSQSISHITFEAFYKIPTPWPYNGNILLDNASAFVER